MAKQVIEFEGVVSETLPGGRFRVNLPDQNREVIASLSGRMRLHHIKIVVGDKVKLEFSPYDLENGRIAFRYSGFKPNHSDPSEVDSDSLPSAKVDKSLPDPDDLLEEVEDEEADSDSENSLDK